MILFAPEYDDQTRACAPIAGHIARSGGVTALLRGGQARRGELLRELRKDDPQACLIFSHGSPEEICGQDGETALVPKDFHSLRNVPVFAYACHSALFGQKAHQQRSVWWGYDKSMVPPPLDVVRKDDVEAIFRYIAHRFHGCSSAEEVKQLIDEIRDLCQKHVGRYWRDQKASMASAVFFMQLWTRLRVWTPWGDAPIAHEQSWAGDLDDAI
jgi:hypothetical protein